MFRRPLIGDVATGEDPIVDAAIKAAFEAVCTAFPFLEPEEIWDSTGLPGAAMLARHVLIHLLVERFDLPKKALANLGFAQISHAHRACHAISARISKPRFAVWYATVVADAEAAFQRIREEANG